MRLQQYLASCGLGSRRSCEELIGSGRVKINGCTAGKQGLTVDAAVDAVTVDGKPVSQQKHVYIMFYKPRGVVTTCRDTHGRATFKEYLAGFKERLFPVGRLDKSSEGLLILTNDGALTHSVTHPRHHVEKAYRVWTDSNLSPVAERTLVSGIRSEGETLKAVSVRRVAAKAEMPCYEIVLREGRKRQIRRMLDAVGADVKRLKRIAIGPLQLGGLKPGDWRLLGGREVANLLKAGEGT